MYPKHELFIGKSKQTLRAHIYPTATVNILSEKDYENLNPKPKLKNEETEILIFGFPTQIAGQFVARLENEDSTAIADFYILPDTKNSIITLNTATKLSLLEETTTRAEFPRNERKDDTHSNTKKTTENKNKRKEPSKNEARETDKSDT